MVTKPSMPYPFRYWLTRAGARLSRNQIRALSVTARYLEMGHLLHKCGYNLTPRVNTREELFDIVGREVGNRDVLYLEFGVYRGESMRYWSKILTNPESKLHGFDSFEGLPEDWTDYAPKGAFDTGGAIPEIDDSRVRFFKGWFNETLPKYEVQKHEVMVLNMDADLYSSTKCVLDFMSPQIVPGTYLYFDEFSQLDDEFRAFMEYSASSGRKFEVRGVTKSLLNLLLQCTA